MYAGSGNNGADGVAVARLLHLAGYPVDLYLAGNHTSFTEEMNIQWQAAKNYQVSIVNNCRFSEYTTIVDALFGVGLSRELSGKYQALAEKINASGIPVLAVDIPSGIHAGTGQVMGTPSGQPKRSPLHTVSLGSVCTPDPSMPDIFR